MRTMKVKSTKHSDLLMAGDHRGPASVQVVTRMRVTAHGQFFTELVLKAAPEAAKAMSLMVQENIARDVPGLMKSIAEHHVALCEEMAMAAFNTLHRNKALGVPTPSYDSLCEKLRTGAVGDDDESVVSLHGINAP